MKYLRKLSRFDDDQKLIAIAGWVNDIYARKTWRSKSKKTGKQISRTELAELKALLIEIADARDLKIDFPKDGIRSSQYVMLFGVGSWNVDIPFLCSELQRKYGKSIESAKSKSVEKIDEDVTILEGYLLTWLATRVNGPKQCRKLSNQILSRMLFLHPEWDSSELGWPPKLVPDEDLVNIDACKTVDELRGNLVNFKSWLSDPSCVLPKKESAIGRVEGLLK